MLVTQYRITPHIDERPYIFMAKLSEISWWFTKYPKVKIIIKSIRIKLKLQKKRAENHRKFIQYISKFFIIIIL